MQCPLKYGTKLCRSRSCSVCRCDQKDIPLQWITTDKVKKTINKKQLWKQQRQSQNKWVWHVQDQQNDQGQYFDVNQNVQSYSGYNGTNIWKLIYQQNCFQGANKYQDMCMQQRVLYNIISGLHTSISSHLSRLHKNVTSAPIFADSVDQNFYFNHNQYKYRLLQHPQRIKNLLFLYQILIRSVKQIIPFLQQQNFISSDNILQDLQAKTLLKQLVGNLKEIKLPRINQTTTYFFLPQNPHVKQYQKYIHNISNILNCVQCQKCKLFGKMQTYGLGTALKILLGYGNKYKRNEIVALFNTLNKISSSVYTYFNYQNFINSGIGNTQQIKQLYQKVKNNIQFNYKQSQQLIFIYIWVSIGFTFLLFIWFAVNWQYKKKIRKQYRHVFPQGYKSL